ncbi:MAG: YaaA family protein [bacterium]|nr:YaaA family protein [bacterium]
MLILLSPAKTFDLSPAGTRAGNTGKSPHTIRTAALTEPRLLEHSQELIEALEQLSVAEIATLMDTSDNLAAQAREYANDFTLPHTRKNSLPAILAFHGEAYRGLAARDRLDTRDLTEAQKTLRILSGLYGVLRPLDLIQPYRLEMGRPLETSRGTGLLEFWGDRLTELIREDLADSPGEPAIINLASQEYAASLGLDALGSEIRVISPRFEDADARGRHSIITAYAKRARGEMAAWLIQNRVRRASQVLDFDSSGYSFHDDASSPTVPVFRRRYADRP